MASPPRILVHVRHTGVLQHLAGPLLELANRGSEIVILGARDKPSSHLAFQLLMSGTVRGVTVRPEPAHLDPPLRLKRNPLSSLRSLANLLHYEHPDYADARWLKERAYATATPEVARCGRRISHLGFLTARIVTRSVRWLDRCMPPSATWERILAEVQPDVVLASPTIFPGQSQSTQVELLRTASRRGIATAITIPSWDNLTSKGRLGYVPDRVFVWNEQQTDELERLHGVESSRAVVAGAPAFDHWFEASPEPRADTCDRLGLDASRPFALYLGSSAEIAPEEPDYFRVWLRSLRTATDVHVRTLQILIRPHPTPASIAAWLNANVWLEREPSIRMWPNLGTLAGAGDALFGNALRHCAVAVGLNTTGMIDAAIHGAPVCTWESAQFQPRMLVTPHYQYLRDTRWGLTHATPNLEEHLAKLAALVRSPRDETHDERSRAFVARFIRPRGIDCPVSEIIAEELLRLAARPSDAPRCGWFARQVGKTLTRSGLGLRLLRFR